jgi:hypothetical protein
VLLKLLFLQNYARQESAARAQPVGQITGALVERDSFNVVLCYCFQARPHECFGLGKREVCSDSLNGWNDVSNFE